MLAWSSKKKQQICLCYLKFALPIWCIKVKAVCQVCLPVLHLLLGGGDILPTGCDRAGGDVGFLWSPCLQLVKFGKRARVTWFIPAPPLNGLLKGCIFWKLNCSLKRTVGCLDSRVHLACDQGNWQSYKVGKCILKSISSQNSKIKGKNCHPVHGLRWPRLESCT